MKNIVPKNIQLVKTFLLINPSNGIETKRWFFLLLFLGACFSVFMPILANENKENELVLDTPLVHQLNNIKPTDWAFTTLQQLMENYGVTNEQIEQIFNNNESLTRDQFAIILNTTLNHILDNHFNRIVPEDLTKIQQLQAQFALELAILRGRVDGLQARVTEQELTQFSSTTNLSGVAIFNLSGVTFAGNIQAEGIDKNQAIRDNNNHPIQRTIDQGNITLSQRVELSLNTSFNGDDLLLTKLVMSNNNAPINELRSTGTLDTVGVPFSNQNVTPNINDVVLQELSYQFPINDSLQIIISPRISWSNYFDNLVNFSPISDNINKNLLSPIEQGGGIITLWQINDQLQLNTAYLSANNTRLNAPHSIVNPKNGLFGGTNGFTAQLTYSATDNVNIQLLYQRNLNLAIENGQLNQPPILGVVDDGKGGNLKSANSHLIGVSFDWFIDPEIRLFGGYNYANTEIKPANNNLNNGQINIQQIQTGINLLDLGKEGTITTFSYTIPFSIIEGRKYLVAGGGNGATEQEFEASYFLPVNDYLAVIPTFYLIVNPNQFSNNHNVYVGNLQMQLLF